MIQVRDVMKHLLLLSCVAVTLGQFDYDPSICTQETLQTADSKKVIACEGQSATLQCDSGTYIQIEYANYGRTNTHVCSKNKVANIRCNHNDPSEQIVVKLCNGRKTCTVQATNVVFGDPCAGTGKYLEVDYRCSASPTLNEPPRPSFKKLASFQTNIEANILDGNFSIEFQEYFDFTNNRGALIEYEPPGIKEVTVYDYKTNEIIIAMPWEGNMCYVEDLTTSPSRFIFGYKKVNDSGHIFTAAGALRFAGDNVKEMYMGKAVVRGITADRWDSCVKWDDMFATMRVAWYFSDYNSWDTALGIQQTPLRAMVTGSIRNADGTLDHNFKHIYDFTQFRPGILSNDADKFFETPKGVVCPGRKNSKPLPKPPTHFQMSAEIVMPEVHMIGYTKEFYDFESNLVRYDYKPLPIDSNNLEFGLNPLSEIHDFNTGVRYIIDPNLGNCSVRQLSGNAFDAKFKNPTTIRIRTAQELFDFDNATYVYTGVRKVREIDAETWVAKRFDYPKPGINSTFEWYFARKDWLQNSMMEYEYGEPVRLEVTIGDPLNIHSIYNIYEFNEDRPSMWNYDIGMCYSNLGRARFIFRLPGHYSATVNVNLELFRYFTMLSIVGNTGISPLRVSQLTVDYDSDSIIIMFLLLDVAPIKGDAGEQTVETPFAVAADLLKETIDAGTFRVTMYVDTSADPLVLTAKPGSLKSSYFRDSVAPPTVGHLTVPPPSGTTYGTDPTPPPSPSPSQSPSTGNCSCDGGVAGAVASDDGTVYKPGVLAAVALVMMMLGFLGGVSIVYFIYRKNGGTLRNMPLVARFENPNYERDEPSVNS